MAADFYLEQTLSLAAYPGSGPNHYGGHQLPGTLKVLLGDASNYIALPVVLVMYVDPASVCNILVDSDQNSQAGPASMIFKVSMIQATPSSTRYYAAAPIVCKVPVPDNTTPFPLKLGIERINSHVRLKVNGAYVLPKVPAFDNVFLLDSRPTSDTGSFAWTYTGGSANGDFHLVVAPAAVSFSTNPGPEPAWWTDFHKSYEA